jgi:recombination protein RecR
MALPRAWENLLTRLRGLPGMGPKMAERVGLYLLRRPAEAEGLLNALQEARSRLGRCGRCGDFMDAGGEEEALCGLCADPARDTGVLCVVEEIGDLQALERCRAFHGRYHVLGGVLSALDGIGPEELRLDRFLDRVRNETVREVILAVNPSSEGETTAAYLADLLHPRGVKVTRLATGLASGAQIQYADEHTLAQALAGRREMDAVSG